MAKAYFQRNPTYETQHVSWSVFTGKAEAIRDDFVRQGFRYVFPISMLPNKWKPTEKNVIGFKALR